jgi:hypothetical protein
MPATYHPVAPDVWDRTMRELSTEAKTVRLYVLTCPSRISEGLFRLPVGIIAHDTALTDETVADALDELQAAGLVAYDLDAEVVLDKTALRHTPLRNGKNGPDARIVGAVRKFVSVPDSPLKAEALQLAEIHSPDLHLALVERLGAAAGERPPKGPLQVASVFPEGASQDAKAPSRAEPEMSREFRGALVSPVGS